MTTAESTVSPPELSHKICPRCHQNFPSTPAYFHQDKYSKSGLTSFCKHCRRSYATTQKDQRRLSSRKHRCLYPERYRLAVKKWRDIHKEVNNARARAYRALYPARLKESQRRYAQAHPEKMRIKNHRQRARTLALPVAYTEAMWQAACAYFHYACAVCGREEGFFWTLAQDHWIPLSDSSCPGTVATNIVPLCHPLSGSYASCNTTKHKQEPLLWLTQKLGSQKARIKHKDIQTFFAYMEDRFPL